MSRDLIRGKTLRFTFDDGPMAGSTFEHRFDENGMVAFHMVGGSSGGGEKPASKYEAAEVRTGVCAVSYLSPAGYTLTTVLDFTTKKLVAFSSNERTLGLHHGSFEETSVPKTKSHARGSATAPRH
jgi:hypothetical protein